MALPEHIKILIKNINDIIRSEETAEKSDQLWTNAGAELMIFIDESVTDSLIVNAITPKDYSRENECVLDTLIKVVQNMKDVNRPFRNDMWDIHQNQQSGFIDRRENMISFYELALSRCCSFISQILGDRLPYIQKLLLKYLFNSSSTVSYYFASDIWMFILRIIHPCHKTAMCLIIMNICRIAPREVLANGAALINRSKHPDINFQNPKYQYLLDFS